MRELTQHKINETNEDLHIQVMDSPGPGGACHDYEITSRTDPDLWCSIVFQNGPVKEAGVNGVTHETLLAILIDRLVGFQSGNYACDDNREALNNLRFALDCLQRRTRARLARGVEGTSAV